MKRVYRKCACSYSDHPPTLYHEAMCNRCKDEGKFELYPLERLIEGLAIINRMYPGERELVIATHDEIFVGGDRAIDDYSHQDKNRMLELGFTIDEGLGKFKFYT